MQQPLAQFFESVNQSAAIIDRLGRVVAWNSRAAVFFGYLKNEVTGRSLNLVYQHNYPFSKIVQETLLDKKKWISNTDFVRKNGSKGACLTCAYPLNFLIKNKQLALVIHYDVTSDKQEVEKQTKLNRKLTNQLHSFFELLAINSSLLDKSLSASSQLEKKLKESELRFLLLAENSTDMISRHAPDGSFLYVSPACKSLLGYSSDELEKKIIYKFIHHEDISRLRKVFSRRRNAASYHTIEFRIKHKDGGYRWFEANARIIRDETTRILQEIQCATRDITSRIMDKKARLRGQQLAHVFRLSTMEEMASGMAHEISQPLAAVVNYTQGCVRYLQKENHDAKKLIEIMNKAVAQAERAGEVIQRLKNFFCKGQLIRIPCKINNLIRETVTLIRNDLTRSHIKVEFDFLKNITIVSADRIQLQQVLLNLIQNSIDAMKQANTRKRKIKIQTEDSGSSFIGVTFSDSGPGFSKDIIHKVFKPFFTTKAHGRGMGLAICRSIIEAHGGEFIIHPNIAENSWIRFTLPKPKIQSKTLRKNKTKG